MAGSRKKGTDPRRQSYYDIDDDVHSGDEKDIKPTTTKATTKPTTTTTAPTAAPADTFVTEKAAGFTFKAKRKQPPAPVVEPVVVEPVQQIKKQRLSQLNKPAAPVTTAWTQLTTPYSTTDIPAYTAERHVADAMDVSVPVSMEEAIKQMTQYELSNISAMFTGPHQYITDAIRQIVEQTQQQYTAMLAEQAQLMTERQSKQAALSNLEQLVDADLNSWFTALQAYGVNTKSASAPVSDLTSAAALKQTYENFAIKGDVILSKLRHIHNVLSASEKQTTQIIQTVNSVDAQMYGNKDSKSLIKSLIISNEQAVVA